MENELITYWAFIKWFVFDYKFSILLLVLYPYFYYTVSPVNYKKNKIKRDNETIGGIVFTVCRRALIIINFPFVFLFSIVFLILALLGDSDSGKEISALVIVLKILTDSSFFHNSLSESFYSLGRSINHIDIAIFAFLYWQISDATKKAKRTKEKQKRLNKKKAGKIKLTPAELRVHYFEKHKQTLGKKWPEYSRLVADENCFWNFIKIRGPQLKDMHASIFQDKMIFENPIDGSKVVEKIPNEANVLYRFDEEWLSSEKALKWLSSKEALQTLERKYIPFRSYCKKESKQEDVSTYYPVMGKMFSLPDRSAAVKDGGECSKCGTTYGMEFVKEEVADIVSYAKNKNKDGSPDRRVKNNTASYTLYDQQYKCYECSTVTKFEKMLPRKHLEMRGREL